MIVQYNQLDLVMHPVFQRLLYVKWNLFGKWGSSLNVLLNLFYTLIWTVLGILIPRDRNYYSPMSENWWRLVLELIGLLLTGYFIFNVRQYGLLEKDIRINSHCGGVIFSITSCYKAILKKHSSTEIICSYINHCFILLSALESPE